MPRTKRPMRPKNPPIKRKVPPTTMPTPCNTLTRSQIPTTGTTTIRTAVATKLKAPNPKDIIAGFSK